MSRILFVEDEETIADLERDYLEMCIRDSIHADRMWRGEKRNGEERRDENRVVNREKNRHKSDRKNRDYILACDVRI